MSPGDAVDLGRPQVRIKGGGKRLQLSLALRSKGAPRDEIHLFKIEIFLWKIVVIQKRYKNTTLYSDVALTIINDFSASLTFCQF